jgi:hypothetical protein
MDLVRSRLRLIIVVSAALVLLLQLAIPVVASAHSSSASNFVHAGGESASSTANSSSQATANGAAQISDLINSVNGFHLNPLVQQLLVSPLQAALTALNTSAGSTKAACSDMANFTRQVGLQAGKGLTIQQARQLFGAAVSIEKILGC